MGLMHRAKVTKVSAAGVWVQCAPIVPGVDFGPCQRIGSAPSVGDWVLVADVGEPASPELIVVGKVTTAADPAATLTAVTASATTSQTGTDIAPYTHATITLVAGVWLVQGGISVLNTVTLDSVTAQLWNTTGPAEVSGSRGTAGYCNTTLAAALATRPVLLNLGASASYRVGAVRNGGSALATHSGAGGPAAWLHAVRMA